MTEGDVVMRRVIEARTEAETKAWDALSRYKFEMFGYWASAWVKYNQLLRGPYKRPNPFRELVINARTRGYGPGRGA